MSPIKSSLSSISVKLWHSEDSRDFAPVRARLPTREESVTQIGTGTFEVDARIASTADLTLLHYRFEPLSVGVSVFEPGMTAFVLPISWDREFNFNGQQVNNSSVYSPRENSILMRGKRRELVAIILRAQPFVNTLAALRGVEHDDAALSLSSFEIGSKTAKDLQRKIVRLLAILDHSASSAFLSATQFENEVLNQWLEVYLQAVPAKESKATRGYPAERIVRKVEECFLQAMQEGGSPLSLADLCKAAHVSKSTLYAAFHHVFGVPPLEYLHKRRLMEARQLLLNASPTRGAVKNAAMRAGLTELGRFSVEYRSLFGESPSAILTHKHL